MSEVASAPGSDVRVVLSTIGDSASAERITRQLVDERLIACANLVPGVTSIYRWEGEVHSEAEVLMILKTRIEALDRLVHRLRELHPYDVPEVVCLPTGWVSEPYARWVLAETAGGRA